MPDLYNNETRGRELWFSRPLSMGKKCALGIHMKQIESKDNPRFKEILRIKQQHSKNPDARIFIEGVRLCMDALISNVVFETIIVPQSDFSKIDLAPYEKVPEIIILSDLLFKKLCSTNNPQGIAAIVESPVLHTKNDLVTNTQDKFLICESIQDPGNLGSIIRTADAFGFTGIIFNSDTVDPFNEKVLRSSMGSIFHIKLIYTESIIETITWLKKNGMTTYATHLKGNDISKTFHFEFPCAIIIGNEGRGIQEETAKSCDRLIRIPMSGKAESLNVSNAAAIICYLASFNH